MDTEPPDVSSRAHYWPQRLPNLLHKFGHGWLYFNAVLYNLSRKIRWSKGGRVHLKIYSKLDQRRKNFTNICKKSSLLFPNCSFIPTHRAQKWGQRQEASPISPHLEPWRFLSQFGRSRGSYRKYWTETWVSSWVKISIWGRLNNSPHHPTPPIHILSSMNVTLYGGKKDFADMSK